MRKPGRALELAALAAITAAAAALRIAALGKVLPDPFYDAAVRSMGHSWHNFFFGAFEPGGSVSIDKPPVDLWLQVISVKVLGFGNTALKVPEVLAGIASVPLLHAVVKRVWSVPAALAAALAMAVLPIQVITSRSDTMDAVMMLTILIGLLFVVKALRRGTTLWLLLGAAALGVAFNVKLLESIVALPGILVLAYLGLPGTRRRRVGQLALATVVYVAISLSWLTATLHVPAHDRPWAIGSTNGSAWNAAFVFNGKDRLSGKSPEASGSSYEAGKKYPVATQEERDHIPILPPSAKRLFARIGPLSGERLGIEILIGLLLCIPAFFWGSRGDPATRIPTWFDDEDRLRVRRAVAAGFTLWMLTGLVLFSHQIRLHPRYVEGFTPVVAAMLGIGVAWAASPAGRARLALLLGTMVVTVLYVERLLYGASGVWWVTLACALAACALALLARAGRRTALAGGATIAAALGAVLAVPVMADVSAIRDHVSDAGYVGAIAADELRVVSDYVREHNRGARYQLAAESSTGVGALIVKDAQPLIVITTYNAQVFTTIPEMEKLIAKGEVRYAFLNTLCTKVAPSVNAACSAPVRWIRENGTDVSREAGLQTGQVLYLLPGAAP
ncbi:MAG TPA: glycosyltransferase family 39 protein [Solirubrobacteraceae bacterium]|jgi:4-amino-4-deoxy-L-arabinose transferase-like glycosyltransferase|nr:glycosyltransferase family 39 protein [Solirubrobacteraceae bacterium]